MAILPKGVDLLKNIDEGHFFIISRGITDGGRGIAPDTVHVAFKEANKHLFHPSVFAFALDGWKYLENFRFSHHRK